MPDLITTDAQIFTPTQMALLDALLNLIIPPSEDGRLPGAAEFDVIGHIAATRPDTLPDIARSLKEADQASSTLHGCPFIELATDLQLSLIHDIRAVQAEFLLSLAQDTAVVYYQQDRVLEGIGMEARTPYPEGYTVESGDLSLLDPVRRRGQIFRDV